MRNWYPRSSRQVWLHCLSILSLGWCTEYAKSMCGRTSRVISLPASPNVAHQYQVNNIVWFVYAIFSVYSFSCTDGLFKLWIGFPTTSTVYIVVMRKMRIISLTPPLRIGAFFYSFFFVHQIAILFGLFNSIFFFSCWNDCVNCSQCCCLAEL